MLADILVLCASYASALVDRIRQHMSSVVCPWFSAPFGGDSINICYMATYAGGEINASRRTIQEMVGKRPKLCVLFLDIDCLMHQYCLGTMDSWKGIGSALKLPGQQSSTPLEKRAPYIATIIKNLQ